MPNSNSSSTFPPKQQTDAVPENSVSSPLPGLSLPKGGGAIRGIGEKFTANPVTGTGSLTIPIATSPGRSGFGPQIALNYDSGSGNGPFGLGWSLNVPQITRKTDKGLPRYLDGQDSDVFILSGAEDLVPVLLVDGTPFEDGTTVQDYTIYRYRPRIEGLFARIERWKRKADGDTHWRSISKDNVTTLYGKGAGSRIADPSDSFRIFSWLISESYDDRGNVMLYDYAAENSDGIDLSQAHEANRTNLGRSANRYLKHIRYGNKVSRLVDPDLSNMDWLFEAVFDYGEHDAGNPQPNDPGKWFNRLDPFSSNRSGFEIRTYRLCRRVLMFHHFDELAGPDYLVRSTEFDYEETSLASFITSATQSGYVRQTNGTYLKKSLPPLDFEYSLSPLQDRPNLPFQDDFDLQEFKTAELENLPAGIDGSQYQWVDLDGEGISGVLTEQADGWFYKPNLGNAHFGPAQTVAAKPSLAALGNGRQQLLDLDGDGHLELAEFERPTPGFYERSENGWDSFRSFRSLPNLSWRDPNVKFVDLTGDGFADVLITEHETLTWYPSLAQEGFGSGIRLTVPMNEEKGPCLVFADGTQSIYLADMTGDGLTDLVRVRNGDVCYWPNLGYGQFGAKITMDDAPWFDYPDLFDHRFLRLTDTDGSGLTDLVYLGRDDIRIYLNQAGNRWSTPRVLTQFPRTDNLSSVMVVDLLGAGTACLVWSSPLPGDAARPLRYIDLMKGNKPHLLVKSVNNLGAETQVSYAHSTKFYLADKAAGKPWITRLAFPVHVVERVETLDRVSRNRFVTRYAYHHGYFDGVEREFRGFGMVEQWDTEEFALLNITGDLSGATNIDAASHVPPILTKTWFHTGAWFEGERITRQFESEYYREGDDSLGESGLDNAQLEAMLLPDTLLPDGLDAEEAREACRALKGSVLRQEVYALDGTDAQDRPYTVSERNYSIKRLQSRESNLHAVFFAHPLEQLDFHYERKLYDISGSKAADPRISHALTLEVDDFGNVLKSAAVGYGRRYDDAALQPQDQMDQKKTHVTFTENDFTNPVLDADAYRVPLPCESRTYELLNAAPASNLPDVTNLFRLDELSLFIAQAGDGQHELPYEDFEGTGASGSDSFRRRIEHVRILYRKNDLSALLPLGQLESRALPAETYKLAFTAALAQKIFIDENSNPNKPASAELDSLLSTDGAYVHSQSDNNWWIRSGQTFYSPADGDSPAVETVFAESHFFLPHRFADPFGNVSFVHYDLHDLLALDAQDPLGNIVGAQNDYRVLQPILVTDPNGNRSAAAFDALGMLVGTALMGKTTENLGDSLTGFVEDLGDSTVLAHLADPLINPDLILQRATTRLVYDLFAYSLTKTLPEPQPAVVYTLTRETHDADLAPGSQTRIQHVFSYSDGFGREIQKKIQAEPGPVDGAMVNPRWVSGGWTIFNNKGKPVRQYEPFFDDIHHFKFGNQVGVSPILFYDPAERVVATLHPNHSWEKVVFDPWRQETWDVNDTVSVADPKADTDVGDFFSRLSDTEYLLTWRQQRIAGALGNAERTAAQKTDAHAETPAVAYFDSLGRPFLTFAHNGFQSDGTPIQYSTRVRLDIEGNQREVIDAKDRVVMRYDYDMLGNRVHQASMDAGERWTLNDVSGKPVYAWDMRGHRFRIAYDPLRRPTDSFLRDGANAEILVGRTVYGETQSNPEAANLRGKVFQLFDQAGVSTSVDYDFKGNPLRTRRQIAQSYKTSLDWSAAVPLETETYTSLTAFDALNRPIQIVPPHGDQPGAQLHVIQHVFNEANLLERVDVWLNRATEPAGLLDPIAEPPSSAGVKNIDYDAKGQRVEIEYNNGAKTLYEYDPETFRLTHLQTIRIQDNADLQDLFYTYDPAGNITAIRDDAQQTVFFNQQVVDASSEYEYDALYRLLNASGREHIGQSGGQSPQPADDDSFWVNKLHPGDGQAMGNYTERYEYDSVGNILKMAHAAAGGGWTRNYEYAIANNRLLSTSLPGDPTGGPYSAKYDYDAHGNMIRMPHLFAMNWDFKDQLSSVDLGGGGNAYYIYDASGQRMRKVVEKNNGTLIEERIYLGGYEVFRRRNANGLVLERQTLHVMDDHRRVAMVETKTVDVQSSPLPIEHLVRYQFDNHLGSCSLELDENAAIISYEEYYLYGNTSYQAVRINVETSPKRYRYTRIENDDESGLYYCGARYYAAWLCRWTSHDPKSWELRNNSYEYCFSSPINHVDPDGRLPKPVHEVSAPQNGQTRKSGDVTYTFDSNLGVWMAPVVEVVAKAPVQTLETVEVSADVHLKGASYHGAPLYIPFLFGHRADMGPEYIANFRTEVFRISDQVAEKTTKFATKLGLSRIPGAGVLIDLMFMRIEANYPRRGLDPSQKLAFSVGQGTTALVTRKAKQYGQKAAERAGKGLGTAFSVGGFLVDLYSIAPGTHAERLTSITALVATYGGYTSGADWRAHIAGANTSLQLRIPENKFANRAEASARLGLLFLLVSNRLQGEGIDLADEDVFESVKLRVKQRDFEDLVEQVMNTEVSYGKNVRPNFQGLQIQLQ